MKKLLPIVALVGAFLSPAGADTITFGGRITQAVSDGTGPAENNPALNVVLDNDTYTVTLTFAGAITAPGGYSLTSLVFSDGAAAADESSFGSISLTVTANGAFDDLSLLGCLTTGSGCAFGNQLDANFRILATDLNALNVAATGLDEPHPLDLLEDDGVTDIHGSITSYSYMGITSTVPEPSSLALLACGLGMLMMKCRRAAAERK